MPYQNSSTLKCVLLVAAFNLIPVSASLVRAQPKSIPSNPVTNKAELVVQLSHGAGVSDVVFSPDSSLLASSGEDGAVKLWDTKTLELRQEFNTSEANVGGGAKIAFTSDGKHLISAGTYVKIWNLTTGQPVTSIKASDRTGALALSPDGQFLACGGYEDLQVWRLIKGADPKSSPNLKILWSSKQQPFDHKSLALSADGKLAVGTEKSVHVLNVRTGQHIESFKSDPDMVANDPAPVAFRSDNSLAMGLGTVQIWSGKVGSKTEKLAVEETEATNRLKFSANGQLLLIAKDDASPDRVRIFDMHSSRIVRTIESDMPDIASATISPDGKYVANGVSFNVFATQLWNAQTGKLLSTWEGRNGGVNDAVVSANRRYLATATDDGPIRVWDTTAQTLKTMGTNKRPLGRVAFSPDSRSVSNNREEVWNVATAKLERVLPKGTMPFMPKVPFVARATKKPFVNEEGLASLFDIALSPDGRISAGAVTGMNDAEFNAVEVWDTNSGKLLHRLTSDGGWVHSVCFLQKGKVLAAGYGDGCIRLWNTTTWKLQQTLSGHIGSVNSIRLTTDGKQLLSSGNDYRVKIWDSRTGALRATLVILPAANEKEISKAWLVYTPQGFYDGSVGVEKWLRWRVGNQPKPASHGVRFRRPNLLKTVLQS